MLSMDGIRESAIFAEAEMGPAASCPPVDGGAIVLVASWFQSDGR